MSVGAGLLTLLLLVAVVVIVSGPLRARAADSDHEVTPDEPPAQAKVAAAEHVGDAAALEAAREAKYRDLREAELDYRTGKLSADDYEAIRGTLRREALEILDALERMGRGPAALDLEQRDRVREEEHGEDDRPAVEVALDERAAAERSRAAADAEGPREARVLAGVHEHEQHHHDGDDDLHH